MSPRETARLQSFPDRLRLWGNQAMQYKQVGNAVPVRLAEALGKEVAALVAEAKRKEDAHLTLKHASSRRGGKKR